MRKIYLIVILALCVSATWMTTGTVTPAQALVTLPQCNNNLDDDGDGKIDYGAVNPDPGCHSWDDPDETDLPQCSDGRDNDGDGRVDYGGIFSDPDCENAGDNSEGVGGGTVLPQCNNNFDDDGDGKVDYYGGDPGCSSLTDTTEQDVVSNGYACGNLVDDDGDTKIDYPADPGCYSIWDTDEGNVAQCNDGVDNDADNAIDMGNVMNWNNGQYYPKDDGCDSIYDDQEFKEYVPPPPPPPSTNDEGTLAYDTDTYVCPETYTAEQCTPRTSSTPSPTPPSPGSIAWTCRVKADRILPIYALGGVKTLLTKVRVTCDKPVANVNITGMLARENPTNNTVSIKDVEANQWDIFQFTLSGNSVDVTLEYNCDKSMPFPTTVLYWSSGVVVVRFPSGRVQKGVVSGGANYFNCW
jgi:hypothetical protein